ncbi:MAG: hypothetical protein GY787_32790, partial [Alteromonadales bacterium]|nr:hypothetical protein [Alteromonadales bacterium]
IESGQKNASVEIQTIDNLVALANANFQIVISNVKGAKIENKLIDVIIIDNEPQLTFDNKFSVTEGHEVIIELTLSAPATQQVTIHYQTSSSESDEASNKQSGNEETGTATYEAKAGEDYTAVDSVAYIAAGATSTTITLNTFHNASTDNGLFFYFIVDNIEGASLALKQSKIEITDNKNNNTLPSLHFIESAQVVEGEQLTVAFSLSEVSPVDISFKYQTIDGTAKTGTDYNGSSGEVTIQAGFKIANITVDTINNSNNHEFTQFLLTLSDIQGVQIDNRQAIITIEDKTPSLSFATTYSVVEGKDITIDFNLPKLGAVGHDITFDYKTINNSAIAGTDFTSASGRITIVAGSSQARLTLKTSVNSKRQESSLFYLEISNIKGAKSAYSQTAITIEDKTPELTFNSELSVEEGDELTVNFTLQKALQHTISFDYKTIASSAVAGKDFTATTGKVTILAGSTTANIKLATLVNKEKQDSTQFILQLTNLTGAKAAQNQAIITIEDNTPEFSFNNEINVKEGELLLVDFTLTESISHDITFDYKLVNGSAVADKDFVSKTGTVTLLAGYKIAQLSLTSLDNIEKQEDSQFILELSNINGGKTANKQAIITIKDNTPELTFNTTYAVKESDQVIINFSLSKPTLHDVTFDYKTTN